ncbi:MAG TPA: DNA alkylation repair protein [Cyclobacteriaceae bacterium]|nr:DNA alkylation repair protein [Cyclobacteriaceae bacterium]HQQ84117.1 DNA alkylation repair protein [Cyclobacteriaceae bacterium]
MKPHRLHREILDLVELEGGELHTDTVLGRYVGTNHPRYHLSLPAMRTIARTWLRFRKDLAAAEFQKVLTSLIQGPSYNEKLMTGILLSMAPKAMQEIDPRIFKEWLGHLEGWAEVDTLCTGPFTVRQVPAQWATWKKLLPAFARSKDIHQRRASIVLLCSPIRHDNNPEMFQVMIANIERLKHEKEILITKAISWVLRSAVTHHEQAVKRYVLANKDTLPKIAVRETLVKIKTGTKTKRKDL